jgi:hypothetical protein
MKSSPVLLCCALVALCACSRSPTSDEDRVRGLLASAEQAAEERDVGEVLEFVDAQYADRQGNTRDSLALFLRAYFATHPRLEIVTSVDDLQFPVDGLARVRMKVRGLELDRFNVGDAVTLDVELRRVDEQWRVVRADRVARD